MALIPLQVDPPDHVRYRKMLDPIFAPRRMAAHEAELPAYPIQNALTAEIRQAAAKANRMEFISLWAGQAAGLSRLRAPGIGAAELVAQLADETRAALSRFTA